MVPNFYTTLSLFISLTHHNCQLYAWESEIHYHMVKYLILKRSCKEPENHVFAWNTRSVSNFSYVWLVLFYTDNTNLYAFSYFLHEPLELDTQLNMSCILLPHKQYNLQHNPFNISNLTTPNNKLFNSMSNKHNNNKQQIFNNPSTKLSKFSNPNANFPKFSNPNAIIKS